MLRPLRSLVFFACLIGTVLGLATTAMQSLGVTPILLAAEQYETAGGHEPAEHAHRHDGQAGHHHDEATWAPDDGGERLFYTAVSNIFAGIGFAAVLLVLMSLLGERGRLRMTPWHGLVMGGLGFLAVFVAPSLGLPPEIPGAAAAPLEARQWWWLATVASAAAGLGLLILARGWVRGIGPALLLVPHAWVPGHDGPLFTHPDPQAVQALGELHHAFLWASGLTNLAFWLLAGLLCAIALRRLQETATMPGPAT
ncbi:CbtA family protein [Halomonas maura]|uniref:CbtA family protein n=1 Tax=Halomonas maura TaxID=117606 RepID=UPI0025B55BE5|nr:CbtA family protein [Halomonas maura]MDN3555478.1 CbtA family protein [Halomonas maura]